MFNERHVPMCQTFVHFGTAGAERDVRGRQRTWGPCAYPRFDTTTSASSGLLHDVNSVVRIPDRMQRCKDDDAQQEEPCCRLAHHLVMHTHSVDHRTSNNTGIKNSV